MQSIWDLDPRLIFPLNCTKKSSEWGNLNFLILGTLKEYLISMDEVLVNGVADIGLAHNKTSAKPKILAKVH